MKLVKDISQANAITHGGTFHADEVFASVILDLYRQAVGESELVVYRAPLLEAEIIPEGAIVYDIGCGKYDHHQRGGNGIRGNDVPYAACGLIWRDFGMEICRRSTRPQLMWRMIDNELVQPIDAVDCGEMPRTEYGIQPCTISGVISAFNPNWDDNESLDDGFMDAFDLALQIFNKIAERAYSKVAAYDYVYECMNKTTDGVMILPKYVPWLDPVMKPAENMADKAAALRFVVYPANRGGYQWRGIPDREGSFGLRKAAPDSWWGLNGEELQKITGIKTAKFCHPNGFIGGAVTLEDTIAMARLALTL